MMIDLFFGPFAGHVEPRELASGVEAAANTYDSIPTRLNMPRHIARPHAIARRHAPRKDPCVGAVVQKLSESFSSQIREHAEIVRRNEFCCQRELAPNHANILNPGHLPHALRAR